MVESGVLHEASPVQDGLLPHGVMGLLPDTALLLHFEDTPTHK